ncbi:MAG: XdhC/CoxF family protein [Alphaproteobacteria bacterium]|nr:XdhC/CoxF family protein [Alphaproteobacteria bacterium]
MRRAILDEIRRARDEKRAVALVTNLKSNQQYTKYLIDLKKNNSDIESYLEAAFRSDSGGVFAGEDGDNFVQIINPPLRLVLIGAVHIAQALASIGAVAGYDVTIIDPRQSFASDARFPNVQICTDWPDDALNALDLDHRTAIAVLSHDPKLDDPALSVALKSPCFYIGALGSKRTHAARVERLIEAGLSDDDISRIRGPIGLDIGAKTPAEIAVAIIAEVTRALRREGSP